VLDADKTIKKKGISPALLNFSPDASITLSAEEPRANRKFDKPEGKETVRKVSPNSANH
jgi:hypothetical protein